MDIYHYDPITGIYTGPGQARVVPGREKLDDGVAKKWMVPRTATTEAPPAEQAGHVRVFANGAWQQVEDHRGETVYGKADGLPRTIQALGALPGDVVTEAPAGPYDRWQEGQGWVEDAAVKRAAELPASVTRRQLLIGLKNHGMITAQEAVAAARDGSVPAAVQAIFDALPSQAEQENAAITWASMSVAERDHPLVAALAAANGMTDAEVDDFFIACAGI